MNAPETPAPAVHFIPPGFKRCAVCGEYRGTTRARYLNWDTGPPGLVDAIDVPDAVLDQVKGWRREMMSGRDPDREIRAYCLCEGAFCQRCGKYRIHRPIASIYDPASNSMSHNPWFMGMAPCAECRGKAANGVPSPLHGEETP